MTDRSNAENADRLDRYLDRSMSPQERESFEHAVGQDDPLRREIDLQTRIDSAVIRAFQPPEMPAGLVATLRRNAEGPTRHNHRVRLLIGLAVAACVVWMTAVAWMFRPPKMVAPRTLVETYHDCVQSGFEPYWKCEFSREFAETFQRRQGQAVRMVDLPEGVHMAGLAYLKTALVPNQPVFFSVWTINPCWFSSTGQIELSALERRIQPPAFGFFSIL